MTAVEKEKVVRLLQLAVKLRTAANRTARMNAEVTLLCEYALSTADAIEACIGKKTGDPL